MAQTNTWPSPAFVAHRAGPIGAAWAAWPLEDDLPGWMVVLGFGSRGGTVELVEHRVTWIDQKMTKSEAERWLRGVSHEMPEEWTPGGLITRRLRSDVTSRVERYVREQLLTDPRRALWFPEGWADHAAKRTGPRTSTDYELAVTAARYVELCEQPDVAAPIERLGQELHLGRDGVTSRLRRAFDRGLYQPFGRGQKGGRLTDHGRRAIERGRA